jgi:hypothetical protein
MVNVNNGYAEQRESRKTSLSIPFYPDAQTGPSPEEQRMHLINRMDGAQFKFLREVMESNQKAMEEGHVGSLQHQHQGCAFVEV